MANHLTGAQRYNNRMDKVWTSAIEALQEHCSHPATYQKDLTNWLSCSTCGKRMTEQTA